VALPSLQEALLELHDSNLESKNSPEIKVVPTTQNFIAEKRDEINDEVVSEILRNFEGARVV
jgi:hypothetical protein